MGYHLIYDILTVGFDHEHGPMVFEYLSGLLAPGFPHVPSKIAAGQRAAFCMAAKRPVAELSRAHRYTASLGSLLDLLPSRAQT